MGYAERNAQIIKKFNALKEDKIRLEAERDVLLKEMEKTYGVSTVEELEDIKDKKAAELDEYEAKIEPLLDTLETDLGI